MHIWHGQPTLEGIRQRNQGTVAEVLDIKVTEIGEDYLRGTVPVNARTRQPGGILHGGVSCLLAETLGSVASSLCLDLSKQTCVGLDINANHIRAVSSGLVYGEARPLHIGRSTHVWEIRITDEQGRLTCISRLTTLIKNRQ